MSCKPDSGHLISEIEWLVKNHSQCIPDSHDRMKPCKNECHTMKITLDVFVKLHQMLQNYIGLLSFRGPKSRDFDCLKIPQNEALDVAVRAMISAMQSSAPKQSSAPACSNCVQASRCGGGQSVNSVKKCDFDKLPELEEVDKKLQRLKAMTLENFENVEVYIKDVLHAITKLPLSVMTGRLEILSSVVRNTKNKLTSCGQPSAGLYTSLMGTQVNPISQIISEFILEYGQMKSKIYPCRKICRFCNSIICPMDRQRNIFCCENARHLNFLWKEWIQQNSVKGVAKWDEDTIMSIVDSFKDTPVKGKRCLPGGPCATFSSTGGQRNPTHVGQNGEGDYEKSQRRDPNERGEHRNRISSGEVQSLDNRSENRRLQSSEVQSKIGHSKTGEKRDSKEPGREGNFGAGRNQSRGKGRESNAQDSHRQMIDNRKLQGSKVRSRIGRSKSGGEQDSEDPGKEGNSGASQKRRKGKGREINAQDSHIQSDGERGTSKTSDFDERSRKKGSKKDAGGVDLNDQAGNRGAGGRKKGIRSGREDPRNTEDDLHPENNRREKSNRKKEGEFSEHSDDRGIGNRGKGSGTESPGKGRDPKNRQRGVKDGRAMDDGNFSERGNGKSATDPDGPGKGRFERRDVGDSRGMTETREKYDDDDVRKSSSEEERRVKSGNGTRGDSGDTSIIQYQLSNKLFVELGWTLLPKDRVMRRVVEFQALLAKPHMNWFKNNKIHGKQYYTDKKTVFMNFLEDGSGQIYYPNGQTAIAAQISKKGTHELYKVYGKGGRDVMGVVRPPWLMGVFDSMGNGVVYNESCNVRLTYNQNGGVYADNPTKVPFSWGWNNFQTFPIDEAVYEDPLCDELVSELVPTGEIKNSSSKTSKQSKSSRAASSGRLSEDRAVSESQKSRPIELGTEVDPNVQINSELVDRDDWTEKMTKSRFHVDANDTEFSPDSSLLEVANEFQLAKNEANSKRSMIAKYRPNFIPSSSHSSPI